MSNNGAEFTPQQVEHQIDMLMQSQKPWPDPLSDARLISELYQVYTDNIIVENVWQRLAERVKSDSPHSVARDVMLQRRSCMDVLPERHERPQRMNVKTLEKRPSPKIIRLLEICAALLVVVALVAGAAILMTNAHQQQTLGSGPKGSTLTVTETPAATETPGGTIVFSDPLSQNIHHWPIGNDGYQQTVFKDNAYHITPQSGANSAVVVSQQSFPQTTLSYQLTMEEVAGDDSSSVDKFGMILCYTTQTVKGRHVTFYAFMINNENGKSQYGFYKYDNSRSYPWQQVSKTMKAGKEFHSGQGPDALNTVKISTNGNSFTFFVNGRLVGTATDASPLRSGKVGMVVNLKGTEVAFSNLLITQP